VLREDTRSRFEGIDAGWTAASGKGPRSVNADAVAAYRDPLTGELVVAVADGIGDDETAVLAARCAVEAAVGVPASEGPIEALLAAQRALPAEGDCVLVVATPFTDRTSSGHRIAWVGDCRAHTWDGTSLHTLTTDQTLAQYLRTHGREVPPRAEHVVTNTVRLTDVDRIGWTQVRGNSGLLLTTDGVHKVVPEFLTHRLLTGDASAADLVTAAHELGGTDNASALVVTEPVTPGIPAQVRR
jgi:protein phosphatase